MLTNIARLIKLIKILASHAIRLSMEIVMANINLKDHGDQLEKYYWDKFVRDKFPSYEIFWAKIAVKLRKKTTKCILNQIVNYLKNK